MKPMHVVLAGALALSTVPAVGQPGPAAHPASGPDRMFSRLDADRDGKITPDEWHRAANARFDRLDANRDGVLDQGEVAGKGGGKRATARAEHMVKLYDANHDGKVTREEYVQGFVARTMRMDRDKDGAIAAVDFGKSADRHAALFRRYDADHDGRITRAELEAAAGRTFDRIEGSRDGAVTATEVSAANDARRARGAAARMKALGAGPDGKVTREAWIAAEDRTFHRLDRNGDGVLSADEMHPGRGRRPAAGQ